MLLVNEIYIEIRIYENKGVSSKLKDFNCFKKLCSYSFTINISRDKSEKGLSVYKEKSTLTFFTLTTYRIKQKFNSLNGSI